MYKQFAFVALGLLLSLSESFAQTDPYFEDAIRYSQTQPAGTARFLGIGGVNNALGGDLSSLAGNPAGLGVYNKSELGVSMGLGFASPNTSYNGTNTGDNRSYIYFPNLGVVFSSDRTKETSGAFKGGSFGVGLTRISNFQNEYVFSGKNTQNSMTDYFISLANGKSENYYGSLKSDELLNPDEMAYYTFLIEPQYTPTPASNYYSWNTGYSSKQTGTVLTKGAINQWNFTYGANFNDNFYLGASLGVPMLRYITDKTYKESVLNNDSLNYFRFDESLTVKGTGVNLKLGFIAKLSDRMRFGMSFVTPTYYGINETYDSYLKVQYKVDQILDKYGTSDIPGGMVDIKSQTNSFKYNLYTPLKVGGGLAYFLGKSGFISADLEYVPYNLINLKENNLYSTAGNSTFIDDNQAFKSLKPQVNFNVGAELRKDVYRFRAGFSKQGDAFAGMNGINRSTYNFSLGAGVRFDTYYADFALVNTRSSNVYAPYTLPDNSPIANIKNKTTQFVISTGLFF